MVHCIGLTDSGRRFASYVRRGADLPVLLAGSVLVAPCSFRRAAKDRRHLGKGRCVRVDSSFVIIQEALGAMIGSFGYRVVYGSCTCSHVIVRDLSASRRPFPMAGTMPTIGLVSWPMDRSTMHGLLLQGYHGCVDSTSDTGTLARALAVVGAKGYWFPGSFDSV